MQNNLSILTTIPTYWQNQNDANMWRAMEYYRRCMCGNPQSLDPKYHQEQIETIRTYLGEYISASCWDLNPCFAVETLELRTLVDSINTINDIDCWVLKAMDISIDPF